MGRTEGGSSWTCCAGEPLREDGGGLSAEIERGGGRRPEVRKRSAATALECGGRWDGCEIKKGAERGIYRREKEVAERGAG